MLIAIDPDVFIASLTDSSCKNMLQQVFEHLDALHHESGASFFSPKGLARNAEGVHPALELGSYLLLSKEQLCGLR